MAKYEQQLMGDFDTFLNLINDGIIKGSVSASLEDGSNVNIGNIRCAVRVYERYSAMGKGRVSLNITLLGFNNTLFLSAITAGGSQAVFMKVNTVGETKFLNKLKEIIENYKRSTNQS